MTLVGKTRAMQNAHFMVQRLGPAWTPEIVGSPSGQRGRARRGSIVVWCASPHRFLAGIRGPANVLHHARLVQSGETPQEALQVLSEAITALQETVQWLPGAATDLDVILKEHS